MERTSGGTAFLGHQRKKGVQVLLQKRTRMALLRPVSEQLDEHMLAQTWRVT